MCANCKRDEALRSRVKYTEDTMYTGIMSLIAASCLCGSINMCLQATDQMKVHKRGTGDTGRPLMEAVHTHTNTHI